MKHLSSELVLHIVMQTIMQILLDVCMSFNSMTVAVECSAACYCSRKHYITVKLHTREGSADRVSGNITAILL